MSLPPALPHLCPAPGLFLLLYHQSRQPHLSPVSHLSLAPSPWQTTAQAALSTHPDAPPSPSPRTPPHHRAGRRAERVAHCCRASRSSSRGSESIPVGTPYPGWDESDCADRDPAARPPRATRGPAPRPRPSSSHADANPTPPGSSPEQIGPTPNRRGLASDHACPTRLPAGFGPSRLARNAGIEDAHAQLPTASSPGCAEALARHTQPYTQIRIGLTHGLACIDCPLFPPLPPPAPGFCSLLPLTSGSLGGRDLHARGQGLLDPQVSVVRDLSGDSCVIPVVSCHARQPCVRPVLSRPSLKPQDSSLAD